MTLALEGIRVLDLTDSVAGPFTTRLLASCGAEVIRVESRLHLGFRRGGPGRRAGAPVIPQGPEKNIDFTNIDMRLMISPNFSQYNHDKLSVALNMTTPQGKELFKKLVKVSDVVVDNMSFGVMQRFGFEYEDMKKLKDDIIVVSMPGIGKGPHEEWSTWGMNLLSLTGFSYQWGHPDTPMPERASNGFHGDYVAGTKAALAIMAALLHRATTGKGQFIEVAQVEATANMLGTSYLDFFINGRETPPIGNRHPEYAPYNCYPCKAPDSWCVIAVFNEQEWLQFRAAMDQPRWAEDVKFQDMASRLKNVEELDQNIAKWTKVRTPHQVMNLLQSYGIAAGAVQNGEDMFYDLQLRDSHFFMEEDIPSSGKVLFPGVPVHLEEGQRKMPHHTAALGEHNDYVYHQLLGLSPEEIKQLEKSKVIF